jgi:hypothetical protein
MVELILLKVSDKVIKMMMTEEPEFYVNSIHNNGMIFCALTSKAVTSSKVRRVDLAGLKVDYSSEISVH